MTRARLDNFAELKQLFNSADQVGRVVVFDIKGNHYRLIAAMHYNTKTVYVLEVLTHVEYAKDKWKTRHQVFD